MTSFFSDKKILLVDDNLEIIEVIKAYLEICGFNHIYEASDGATALNIIETHDIDLVISDVRMPGMNGVTLLEKAVKQFPEKPIFIMITSYAEISLETAKMKGAKELLTKPLDLDSFIEKIQTYLQN